MHSIFIIHSLTHSPSGHIEGIGAAYTPDGGSRVGVTSDLSEFAKVFYLNGVNGAIAEQVYRDTIGSTEDKAKALRAAGLSQVKY